MMRWARRTSPEEDSREQHLASLTARSHGPYDQDRIYLKALEGSWVHRWGLFVLLGISVLAGTGFGGLHRAGEWGWAAALSLAAAGLAHVFALPSRSLESRAEDAATMKGGTAIGSTNAWMCFLAGIYFLVPAWVSGAPLQPVAPSLILTGLSLVVCGSGDLMRRMTAGLMVLAAPAPIMIFLWRESLLERLTLTQTSLIVGFVWAGLGLVLALQSPAVPHPTLTASRISIAAVVVALVCPAPGGVAPGPLILSWWLPPVWILSLGTVFVLETSAFSPVPLVVFLPPFIHLAGLLGAPAVYPGPREHHLLAAGLEFLLTVWVCHQRWRAYVLAEYAPRNYRRQTVFVPRLDRGQDHPLESHVLE